MLGRKKYKKEREGFWCGLGGGWFFQLDFLTDGRMRTTIICDPAILKTSQVNEQQMENRENRYIKRKRTEIDPPMDGSDFQQPVKCMRTYMGNLYNQQEHQYEFVNVMFDSNLLPVQNPIISEANSANLAEFSANWSTNDLLDLDQKTPSYGQQTHLDTFTPDSGHRHTKNPVNSEPNNREFFGLLLKTSLI